jgi:hypothetical protein
VLRTLIVDLAMAAIVAAVGLAMDAGAFAWTFAGATLVCAVSADFIRGRLAERRRNRQ